MARNGGESKTPSIIFQYNSPVILTFALISFIVLVINILTNGRSNLMFFTIYKSSFTDLMMYLRMFTYIFGHANISHYISNFTIILLAGPMIEEKYGSRQLVEMIAITAVTTGLINILFFDTGLIGASGIAFMLILLSSFANYQKGKIPLTLICVAVIYLGGEIYDGLFTQDNISQLAHIIGGICGCIFGWFVTKK